MILLGIAVLLTIGLVLPHRLDLRRATPSVAVAVWSSALVLRAGLAIAAVILVVRYVPATEVFASLTHWCWHTVLPVLSTHLGLDGHVVGDVAVLLPVAALMLSLIAVGHSIFRAARAIRAYVRRAAVGRGPEDSVIVSEAGVLVAAAGITRPQLIVSPLALAVLDDEELHASLGHERGHVARRHRYVLLIAELLCSIGRLVPGAGQAVREVRFHLERDADQWVTARGGDRLALASAICKAAQLAPRSTPVLTALSGGAVVDRVAELMDDQAMREHGRASTAVAVWVSAVAVAVAVALPSVALAGTGATVALVQHCTT